MRHTVLGFVVALAVVRAAAAQSPCLEWSNEFATSAFQGEAFALAEFDDGSGNALYVAGALQRACDVPVAGVARYDGSAWTNVGAGIPGGLVTALCVFDDGGGAKLYAGGTFATAGGVAAANIAAWDGSAWTPLASGLDGAVQALAVHDDGPGGTGPALYAGGAFTHSGATALAHVARWDGSSWTALGAGTDDVVYALASHDDGSGAALFAGGAFGTAGGAAASRIARWQGGAWSALGSGLDNVVLALRVHDEGAGARLFAGGLFSFSGSLLTLHVARWDGGAWSALGGGINNDVYALASFDDGGGARLYGDGAQGSTSAWNGAAWSALGAHALAVRALQPSSVAGGARLYVAGGFGSIGGIMSKQLATYGDGRWAPACANAGLDGPSYALEVFDDGTGAKLCVAGNFQNAGGVPARAIASYDGASWSALGSGVTLGGSGTSSVRDMQAFDDGSGPALYVGGSLTLAGGLAVNRVARWNGSAWSALGAGLPDTVTSLCVFDDGGGAKLYAALDRVANQPAVHVWNGASWSPIATTNSLAGRATKLLVHDDGAGPKLYAAGAMTISGVNHHVARLDGTAWTGIAQSLCCGSDDLISYKQAGQPRLADVGWWSSNGPFPLTYFVLREWDGATWTLRGLMPGSGTASGFAQCAALFDDGQGEGPLLHIGGYFLALDGVPLSHLARWNGATWSALGAGIFDTQFPIPNATALQSFDDRRGGGPDLFVAGWFDFAGGQSSSYIARWSGCEPGERFCTGDGLDPQVTTDCPCSNPGAGGHGCSWSNNPAGAELVALGSASADSVLLTASAMPLNGSSTIFLKGDVNTATGVVFGDGVRCVDGNLIRLAIKQNVNGVARFPEAGNASLAVRGQTPPGSGLEAFYQVYYRNAGAYCTSATFNVTNGWRITW